MPAHATTPAQRRLFAANGYLVLRGVLARPEWIALRDAVQRVIDGDDEGIRHRQTRTCGDTVSTQLQQVHRASRTVRDYLRHGPWKVAAELMATDQVRLWHDQVIHKGAGHGGRVPWHQDYFYWRHLDRPSSVTAWTALTASHAGNGGVWVVPGSHLNGILPDHGTDGIPFEWTDPEPSPSVPPGCRTPAVALTLAPGDVSFHHCLTLHGSGENRSGEPRFGYVTHFLPRGIRYRRAMDTVREHEVEVADGGLITGQGFPVLYTRPCPSRQWSSGSHRT